MRPETHLVLHHYRAAELQAEAEQHRLAIQTGDVRTLRARFGWTLVEVGLRLAAPPRTAPAC